MWPFNVGPLDGYYMGDLPRCWPCGTHFALLAGLGRYINKYISIIISF